MLIPPKPWSAPNIGGYLSNQSLIMRVRGSTMQINQLFAQHREGKLSQVCTLSLPSCIPSLLPLPHQCCSWDAMLARVLPHSCHEDSVESPGSLPAHMFCSGLTQYSRHYLLQRLLLRICRLNSRPHGLADPADP